MWELIASVGVVQALVFGVSAWERYRRLQVCLDAAEKCGLGMEEHSWFWGRGLKLRVRAGPVEVRIEDSQRKKPGIAVVLPERPGFYSVTIRHERHKPSPACETGDELFDKMFFIAGPMRLLYARLDAETRRLLLNASSESSFEIDRGALWTEMFPYQMRDLLPLLLAIDQRFSRRLDIAPCLAENAHRDPEAGVRLRNLLLLAREFPGEPGTTDALRNACSDASPQVRLRAAQELGAEGYGVLAELAECSVDDDASAQAVSALGRELPIERTRAILVQALRRRLVQTARACLEALGGSGAAEDVDMLAKVIAREKGAFAAAAAAALGTTGSPAAEPPLILALQGALQGEVVDLQVAAANALSRVGTAAAVLPLKEVAERSSHHHPELRKAARQAIAEIQYRLQGASPGQLSLADPEAGQLSLAQAEAGQLSLATDPAGRLSLPPEESGQLSLNGTEEG